MSVEVNFFVNFFQSLNLPNFAENFSVIATAVSETFLIFSCRVTLKRPIKSDMVTLLVLEFCAVKMSDNVMLKISLPSLLTG